MKMICRSPLRWCFGLLAVLALAPAGALAFHPPEGPPLENIDARASGVVARDEAAETALAAAVPGVRVDRDRVTGGAAFVAAEGKTLTRPVRTRGAGAVDHGRVVRDFLEAHRGVFRHGAEALAEARTLRDFTSGSNGVRTMVWQQELDGVRVFESTLQAHVTAAGELVNVSSRMLANAGAASKLTAAQRALRLALPALNARQAVLLAARNLGEPIGDADLAEEGAPEGSERRQSFRATALPGVTAELRWLPLGENDLRLCWEILATVKRRGEVFRVLIDAQTGEAPVRQGLTNYLTDASYRVFTSDSPTPFSPGHPTPLTTQPATASRTLVTTPALNVTASPNGWIDDGVNETRGNNVDAHLDLNADNVADTPRPQGAPNRVFDFPIDFALEPTTYRNAAVTQLFYLCNWMHDKLYALGFTEAAGNFQNNTFGRGGVGNDAVQADAQDGSGTNNANFSTLPDGTAGRMQMYVFTGPVPDRDGDFDAEIVLHEYTHGLSNRLVGAGVGLSALQPRGMGEGWSDFYALSLLSEAADNVNGNYAKGGYATYQLTTGFTQNYYYGIRRYPYSTDLLKNPLTLKDIDPTKASPHTGIPISPIFGGSSASEVHNQGEVWCVTLWEARANLIVKHGYATGNQLILQLVTDGMKLAPANPTFLQARDAIIQADVTTNAAANRLDLWRAFAKRGMGASAFVPVNSTTTGVLEAFDLPDDLGVSPTSPFTSSGSTGGPFSPVSKVFTLSNSSAAPLNWTATKTQPWLTLSATAGTLAPGATTTVTATLNAAANTLPAGLATDVIVFRNLTNSATQTRAVALDISPPRLLYYSLDTDPGWTRTGQWAFGHPTGGGGLSFGFPDPANGATGVNVFGVNLAGDYSTAVGGPYFVTLGPINLTNSGNTRLQFQRWLNSDYQNWAYATIEVSTNGTTWTNIFSNGTTPYTANAWTKVQHDISALVDGRPAVYLRWGYQIGLSDVFAYSGWNIDDIEILGAPPTNLTLTAPASTTEGAGPLSGTVTLSPAPTTSVTVTLSSSDPTEAALPASVVIPAGQTSATFAITIGNDALPDGSQSPVLTASAAGYPVRTATLVVHDDETAVLSLAIPATATEGDTGLAGTVTMSAAAGKAVTVALTSSDPAELTVPATVTIPAGLSNATFPLAIVNDTRIDGAQSVAVTANVTGWTAGSAAIAIADNETKQLSVTLPTMREGDTGKTGLASIPGTLTTPLVVTLASSDTTEATVPATVTILAGQTSATFPITVVDDTLADGAQPVTVTASAAGFVTGQTLGSVGDNEAHHFTLTMAAGPQLRNAPIALTITAVELNGIAIPNFTGTVQLSATGDEGTVPITPVISGAFASGVWAGNVAIGAYGSGIRIVATAVSGQTGQSAPFEVVLGPLHHLAWSTVGAQQAIDAPFAATLIAADAAGNPVAGFNGDAAITAQLGTTSLPVQPEDAVNFTAGTWSGAISVPVAASGLRLRATAGALSADSNAFDVTVPVPPNTSGTIYSEDFESGVLPAAWTITGTGNFRTQITNYSPHGGSKHLAMDEALNSGSYARNEATLTLNLAGRTGVVLKFWAAQFGEEPEGPPASPFPGTGADFDGVAISADGGANWYEVVGLRTLTATYTQLTVDLDAALAARGLAYSSTFKIRFNQYDNFSLGTDGIGIDDILVTATPLPIGLTVNLPAQAVEGSGTIQGSVSVTTAQPANRVLNLFSKSAAKVTVPATVTIPGGQTSATFPLTVLDDPFVDGTKNVVITAAGAGFAETGRAIAILDNDGGALTLTLPATVVEGASAAGTVGFSVPALVPITVALASNDASEVFVPATITLGVGQTSGTFNVGALDDGLIDGTQTVTLTAQVAGWTNGTATIRVLDNGRDATREWPTFGNGPAHTGYQPIILGNTTYLPGWTKTYPNSTSGLNQVAISAGTVFVTPNVYFADTYLSALDSANGTERWRQIFLPSFSINPPTVDAGKVYVQKGSSSSPGNDPQLWCLNTAGGTTEWIAPFTAQFERYYAPTVVGSGVWVDGGTYGGLYGFNTANGSQRFFNSLLEQYDQWTPSYYNGTIYTWVAGIFRAHDPVTGTILWSLGLSTGTPYSMNTVSAIDAGRALVIGVPNLYAIDLSTRAAVWTVSGAFKGTPAVANGRVYALLGSDVKAYNSQSGALLGTYATGNSAIAGQPIVTNDSLIVTTPTNTYIFNLQTFSLRQTLPNGGAASLASGVFYLAGADGILRTYRPPGQNAITLTLPASAAEGSPALTGTVSLASAPVTNTVIGLTAGGSSRVSIPNTVTILAGQTSTTFPLTVVDDALLNGSQTITLLTVAPSFAFIDGSATFLINDNETAQISLSVPASAAEGAAAVTGNLTLSGAPSVNISVNLTSSDTTEVTVPATVTVLAGQTTATFPITVINDTQIDGPQTATITATVPGWTLGSANIQITDNETTNLALSGTTSITEGTIATNTVTISGTLSSNLTISLSSANPAQLTVPASVVIPAGATSVNFTLTAVDDTVTDGTQVVTITAAAASFTNGTMNVSVADNDVHHFTFSTTIATPQIANKPFSATVEARDINNLRIFTYNGALTLTGGSTSGAVGVTPATITLASGYWNGTLAIGVPATGVTITASAGAITGVSNSFDVSVGTLDHFTWSAVGASQTTSVPFNATVMAKDLYENTVTSVNGAATVSAGPPARVTGTGASDYFFLFESSLQERNQAIYQPAEIGVAGRIASLSIQANILTAGTISGVTIRMKHTALTGYLSPAWEATGWTVVYQGSLTVAGSGATWLNIPLSTPFQYDGTSNLMVDISHNSSTGIHVHATGTPKTNTRTLFYSGSGFADPLTWTGTTNPVPSASTGLMNLRLRFEGTLPLVPSSVTLANGLWSGTVAVQQAASGIALTAQNASGIFGQSNTFNVTGPAVPSLVVSPAAGLPVSGLRGGPFTPASQNFTLTNVGNQPLAWTLAKNASWLDLSATSGNLDAGASTTMSVNVNAGAASLASGTYNGILTFTNSTNGVGTTTRTIALTVTAFGELTVTPATSFDAIGAFAGPFTPASRSYTLSNPGDAALNWTAAKTAAWLSLSATAGTLAPGATTTVIATIVAPTLDPGSYNDSIVFTNTSNGRGNTTRSVTLTIALPAPVLAPEPPFTGGSANTVSWTAVTGASQYEVQAAASATFTSPVSSGWIPETSYTFTALSDGATYHYRVRARRAVPEITGAWTQTSQAEFDTGAAGNVSTSATPGSVVLAQSANLTEHFDQSGAEFTTTIFSDIGGSEWTRQVLSSATYPNTLPFLPINQGGDLEATGRGSALMVDSAANRFANGSIEGFLFPTEVSNFASFFLRAQRLPSFQGYAAGVRRDTTTTGTVQFYRFVSNSGSSFASSAPFPVNGANECFKLRFTANGTSLTALLWRVTVNAGSVVETPVILEGGATVMTRTDAVLTDGMAGLFALATSGADRAAFDEVTVNAGTTAGYAPSGTLTSALIAPLPRQRWGSLAFAGNTSAAGTAMTVDALNAAGALLAANIASGSDLHSLAAVAAQPSIRLRANLSTTNPANTPRLDDWTVNYVISAAAVVESAWSNAVLSTQDTTAPQFTITSSVSSAFAFHSLTGTAADLHGIGGVTINGAVAQTADAFAHWNSPQLHLVPGVNTFTIIAADNAAPANTSTTAWTVTFTAAAGDLDGDGLPDAWESAHGLDPADDGFNSPRQGPAGDLDFDGLPNLAELALDLDPAVMNPEALPRASVEMNSNDGQDYLVFTYRRPLGSTTFTFAPEISSALGAWDSAPSNFQQIAATPVGGGTAETVKVRVLPAMSAPGGAPKFIRLRVSLPATP